jgi:hypothetical protein
MYQLQQELERRSSCCTARPHCRDREILNVRPFKLVRKILVLISTLCILHIADAVSAVARCESLSGRDPRLGRAVR